MIELNLRNRAATQTTAQFNSMCRIGDTFVGATESGLFRMCGVSDNGIEIPAHIKTGMVDLGTERFKRIAYIYLGIETTGAMQIELWCDGIYKTTLDIVYPGAGYREVLIAAPKGLRARYWQFKIRNVDGSFFVLYSMKLLPIVLKSAKA